MLQFLTTASYWLHSLATIILIGHYLLLSLFYIPALTSKDGIPAGVALGEISKRSRVWIYVSLLVFFVTGIYLTIVDSNYLGIGNFGNLWGVLMLVKHILILVMIAIGFWFNAILRVGSWLRSSSDPGQAIARFRRHANTMAICGVLVLLLTALAQVN